MLTKVNAVITVTVPTKARAIHAANCIFGSNPTLLHVSCVPGKKKVILSAIFEDITPPDLESIVSEFEAISIEALMKVINHAPTSDES